MVLVGEEQCLWKACSTAICVGSGGIETRGKGRLDGQERVLLSFGTLVLGGALG